MSNSETTCARLNVVMASCGKRLENLSSEALPDVDGVKYIITCQASENERPDVAHLARKDIEILFFDDKGLARNRNHGLDAATAPVILIADDDTDRKSVV